MFKDILKTQLLVPSVGNTMPLRKKATLLFRVSKECLEVAAQRPWKVDTRNASSSEVNKTPPSFVTQITQHCLTSWRLSPLILIVKVQVEWAVVCYITSTYSCTFKLATADIFFFFCSSPFVDDPFGGLVDGNKRATLTVHGKWCW